MTEELDLSKLKASNYMDAQKRKWQDETGAFEKIKKLQCPVCGFKQLWEICPPKEVEVDPDHTWKPTKYNTICRFCGSKMWLDMIERHDISKETMEAKEMEN